MYFQFKMLWCFPPSPLKNVTLHKYGKTQTNKKQKWLKEFTKLIFSLSSCDLLTLYASIMRSITLLESEVSVPTADFGMRFFSSCKWNKNSLSSFFYHAVFYFHECYRIWLAYWCRHKILLFLPGKQAGTLQLLQIWSECCFRLIFERDVQ